VIVSREVTGPGPEWQRLFWRPPVERAKNFNMPFFERDSTTRFSTFNFFLDLNNSPKAPDQQLTQLSQTQFRVSPATLLRQTHCWVRPSDTSDTNYLHNTTETDSVLRQTQCWVRLSAESDPTHHQRETLVSQTLCNTAETRPIAESNTKI
jgi:hypothetical protein